MLFSLIMFIFISTASVQSQTTKSSKLTSSQPPKPKKEGNIDSFSITPSFSYQYHTNDHGDYETDVANSGTTRKKNKENIQWDDFAQPSDPKFSLSASPVLMDSYPPQPIPIDIYGPPLTPRDSYEPHPSPPDNYAPPPPLLNSYAPPAAPAPTGSYAAPYQMPTTYGTQYGANSFGGPSGGGGSHGGPSGGGVGPSGGGPPPPAIKGSIDYVLIPLILIGIAGPIFVVLYVVLGAFEAKLSPITVRSNTWSGAISNSLETLKPATDLFFGTLTRALDHHECMERAMCHVGSFGRFLGLQKLAFMNKTVEATAIREPYKRSLKMFFSSMTNEPESCSAFKCP